MSHELVDIAFSLVTASLGWLIVRFVGRLDCMEEQTDAIEKEVRITRAALSRIEGHLGLDPFPFEG